MLLRLVSIGLFSLSAGSGAPVAAAATQEPPPARTPSANEAVRSPGNADWAADWNDAKARAAKEQKLVFVEVDAPECGNCRRMDALLYPAMDFEALLMRMVPVKIQLPSGPGRELADKYQIRNTPTILITTPEGRLVFRMEGFMNGPDFYEHVRADLEKYRQFAKRIESQDIAKLSAAEALDTGRELYERVDPESALPRLRRAATHPKATAAQRDSARETLVAAELDLGETAAAKSTIDKILATTKDPARRESAEVLRAQAALMANNPREAIALFHKFQNDHPNSPYNPSIRATLLKLEGPGQ